MTVPSFGGEIRDGRVWGRGSCDTKASAAIAIKLIFEAMQHGKRPNKNLLLVFSMGEETGGEGAQKVNPWIKRQGILVDQWITSEPTMLKCVFAHNGVVRGQLLVSRRNGARDTLRTDRTLMCFQVTGRSGHTSDPDKASNALYAAAKLALRIREVNGLHVTAFECGGMGNTIPNSCIIVVEQENAVHQSRAELNSLIVQLAADLMDEHLKINCMDPHQASRQMAEADSEVIYAAVRAILTFENEHQRLKTKGLSSVTGLPVISATGLTSNPDATCTISFDRRVVPGEVPNTVFEELLARLEEAMQNPAMVLSVVINPPMRRLSGFATDPNSTLIQELVALSGNQPTTARYGTNLLSVDSQVFVDGKIVAVVFGPGDIAQAHTANEYIEIKQLELAYSLMKRFLGLAA